MESMDRRPTPAEAAAALADAEGGLESLADRVVVPRWFFLPIGVAVALQIGTTAAGLGMTEQSGRLVVAGFAVLLAVAVVQLARFRGQNGIWLGGLLSRVIGGTATAATVAYGGALAGAIWAATADAWWLVPILAVGGGAGYALSGRAWMRSYRAEPADHGRGEPALVLVVVGVLALSALLLLVSLR